MTRIQWGAGVLLISITADSVVELNIIFLFESSFRLRHDEVMSSVTRA